MNQILRFDLLPERARWRYLTQLNPYLMSFREIKHENCNWDKQDKTFVINPPDINV